MQSINADLTAETDITKANQLEENRGLSFIGDQKSGPFDLPDLVARQMLSLPRNANGCPNGDVIRPWMNGLDITRRPRHMWIVDFGVNMPLEQAALYEAPFEHVAKLVKPERMNARRAHYRNRWWLHGETRPGMRSALRGLSRYLATPRLARHRLWVWIDEKVLPDSQIVVVARQDDYFFGVLHSRAHEVWSLRMGTSLEDRPRYTPTTCFETFPSPGRRSRRRGATRACTPSPTPPTN